MREVLQESRSKPDNRGMMSECRFDGVIETMVAELGPISSEKRPLLLNKEPIIEKIDENLEIQTTLET